jgi:tetratricopeptide (TPR) repeat protein
MDSQVERHSIPQGRLRLAITFWGLIFSTMLAVFAPGSKAHANAALGRKYFSEQKYDAAITEYRKHLRKSPSDYETWDQLGAAYYHTGLPKRGLRYLKQVQRKTPNRSYNYFYQGLCYVAITNGRRARQYFSFVAARYGDEYADRAAFELALLEYKAKDVNRARYALSYYQQRFPGGIYRSQADRMSQSLNAGVWLPDIEGTAKPDMEKALFKYNSLSFGEFPHYWFAQLGGSYSQLSGKEPAPGGQLKDKQLDNFGLLATTGIGAGPLREGSTTAFVGYTYRQQWLTDRDRLDDFGAAPSVAYFPFRADLLERRHQIYGDFRRDVFSSFYFGLFGRFELIRIGSSLFPSPDPQDFQVSQNVAQTMLFIPWIGFSYLENFRTLGYFYFRHQYNEDSKEHSNQTYEIGGQSVLSPSMGLSHSMEFPAYDLAVDIEIFKYQFTYNDAWLDYDRLGFIAGADHELIPDWNIQALVGMYQDQYISRRPKTGKCKTVAKPEGESVGSDVVSKCQRNDSGILMQAGIQWNWTQFRRLAFQAQFVENKSPNLLEFDESKTSFLGTFTYAFPSVKRIQRFVDRFADTAFTKEAE